MALPSTQPLDGEFWYVLDDQDQVVWKPRPKLRGDFYLGWLGQNKNVIGAGLACLTQGQLTHLCTHGTPYFWLQPYQVLAGTRETLRSQHVSGADTVRLDYSMAGWGIRDQTPPQAYPLPDHPIPSATLRPLLPRAIATIVNNFRSEGEPPPPPSQPSGLLARAQPTMAIDPLKTLLEYLEKDLGKAQIVPALIELVSGDINVLPAYRQARLFEDAPVEGKLSPPKIARVVLSATYHLAPALNSRRLNGVLLVNSLRQRHPFDVTWGADSLVKCFGMSTLVKLLQIASVKEKDDQVRGNVLDMLQELGYGLSAGLGDQVLKALSDLIERTESGFGQVLRSHWSFLQTYMQQRADDKA